nr:MAG TPA: hypothetical protein [Caudoviricetes sp.]
MVISLKLRIFAAVVDVDVAKILTVSINTNFYQLKVSLFTTFN